MTQSWSATNCSGIFGKGWVSRTTNIDLDSRNHFDPLPFGGETHASSFQTYFYHGWNGDIQPTQCCYQMCTDHPAWCTACFLFRCLFGLNPGQTLTSAEIINISSLPSLHKSFKQTNSHCLPPEPCLRFSSWYLIMLQTGCFTSLSLWWPDKHPFTIKSPWSVTVLQSLWSVLG